MAEPGIQGPVAGSGPSGSTLGADMAEWTKRAFTKGEIDRAGLLLSEWWRGVDGFSEDAIDEALDVAQNWRTSHSYPLNAFQVNLRSRARRVESDVLVAQRLKRFSSMMNKLVRQPNMKLSQMQDVGGCRAILSDTTAAKRLAGLYPGFGDPRLFASESVVEVDDYVSKPKGDGYRGIHVVGRYSARSEPKQHWNGQRIEVQIRSKLQHAFATAVETVTTFTREPLKFGSGPESWRRFFSLMGSAFADIEKTPPVPGTPTRHSELVAELSHHARELQVQHKLTGWTDALKALPKRHIKGAKWMLLMLNTATNTVSVVGFTDRAEADRRLVEIEQSKSGKQRHIDAVLVWVKDAKMLRAAYPNYYADTKHFLGVLDAVLKNR